MGTYTLVYSIQSYDTYWRYESATSWCGVTQYEIPIHHNSSPLIQLPGSHKMILKVLLRNFNFNSSITNPTVLNIIS